MSDSPATASEDGGLPQEAGAPAESPYRTALRRAGEWYLAQQNERFLHYSYDPDRHHWEAVHHPVRELAALWAITSLGRRLGDKRFLDLAERGLLYFGRSLHHSEEHDITVLGITPSKVKISFNAFLVLTLLELGRPDARPLIDRLARGILFQQQRDGRLRTHFNSNTTNGQDYYPGQALLALMALFDATGEERYLKAVEKAFPYYRGYWRETPKRPFIPWQTQAFCRYHKARPNPDVADFVFEMNDKLFAYLARPGTPTGFDFSGGIIVAVYIEGLCRAYVLAREYGDKVRALRYGTLVRRGLQAILALQCPKQGERAEDFHAEALGGFYPRQDEREMRVDHNQHAIMALLGAMEVGLVR